MIHNKIRPDHLQMSEEQLRAFLKAVKADADLQDKLKMAADPSEVEAIAKAAGFAISADELNNAQSAISEDELENIAGGLWYLTFLSCFQFISCYDCNATQVMSCLD